MKVIICDTNRPEPKQFENVEATTFGELKAALSDVDFSNKAVVIRETGNSLELDDARLPNTDELILYLSQKKIKGGATPVADMSRSELMAEAKKLREANEEAAKELGNYTTTKSDELREILSKYQDGESDVNQNKQEILDAINGVKEELGNIGDRVSELELEGFSKPCPSYEELRLQKIAEEANSYKV